MKNNTEAPKIGAGHAEAMVRLGLKELRAAFYPESNVAQPAEYGLYGTRTPGEVAESRKDTGLDLEQEKDTTLGDRLQMAEARGESPRETKELEKE